MGYHLCCELHENKRYIYFTTDSDFQYWEFDKILVSLYIIIMRLKLIELYLIVINMIQINM